MTAADLHPDTSEPRPGSCCGVCPPIAGGGWDCTCPGMLGCPVNAPAAEWDDLARLAQAATPGPWRAKHSESLDWLSQERGDDTHQTGSSVHDGDPGNPLFGTLWPHRNGRADARFIAAANPATILRLIEDRNALAARLAAVEALADEWEHKVSVLSRQSESRAGLSDADQLAAVSEFYAARSANLRAALAAPTDTTKEN